MSLFVNFLRATIKVLFSCVLKNEAVAGKFPRQEIIIESGKSDAALIYLN